MLHINIITVGKLKEAYWREAAEEYTKRLRPFAKIEIVEIKEETFDEKSNPEIIKAREAEKILAALNKIPDAFVIALDQTGKTFSSEAFSKELTQITMRSGANLAFIIGGPLGLNEKTKKLARLTCSFSALTFTHQMVRVILLEQLYRAMMIAQNRPYHY